MLLRLKVYQNYINLMLRMSERVRKKARKRKMFVFLVLLSTIYVALIDIIGVYTHSEIIENKLHRRNRRNELNLLLCIPCASTKLSTQYQCIFAAEIRRRCQLSFNICSSPTSLPLSNFLSPTILLQHNNISNSIKQGHTTNAIETKT